MTITYHGHSCFKLKGKLGSAVTDPYSDYVGFNLPALSADVVTISHQHQDHNAAGLIKGTSRRKNPFVIEITGEYEVGGISVFGTLSSHDKTQGAERGINNIYTILIDGISCCHLGDLGHELTEEMVSKIGMVDVLFLPVGGVFTTDPKEALSVVRALEPSIVIPMHYNTAQHNQDVFKDLKPVEEFIKVFGTEVTAQPKIDLDKDRLPEEMELVVLSQI